VLVGLSVCRAGYVPPGNDSTSPVDANISGEMRKCCTVKTTTNTYGEWHNLSPRPPLIPSTDRHQNLRVDDYVWDTYHHAKFYPDRMRGFVSVPARLCAPNCLARLVLSSSSRLYSQDATTDIDAKYVKRHGSESQN